MLFEEPDVKRFRISQEDLPVVDEQLESVDLNDKFVFAPDFTSLTITDLEHHSADESWEYTIEFDRFRIEQLSSGG